MSFAKRCQAGRLRWLAGLTRLGGDGQVEGEGCLTSLKRLDLGMIALVLSEANDEGARGVDWNVEVVADASRSKG